MQMQYSTRWTCAVSKNIESQFWQFIWNSSREIKKQWSIDWNEFFKLCCSMVLSKKNSVVWHSKAEFFRMVPFFFFSFLKQNLPIWVGSLVLPVVWHCLGRHCHADSGGGYLPPRQNFQPPLSCLLCLPCFFLFHLFSKIGFDSGGGYLPPHQNVQPPFLSFLFAFNCVDHSLWLFVKIYTIFWSNWFFALLEWLTQNLISTPSNSGFKTPAISTSSNGSLKSPWKFGNEDSSTTSWSRFFITVQCTWYRMKETNMVTSSGPSDASAFESACK